MIRLVYRSSCLLAVAHLSGCAVGPGTSLVEIMRAPQGQHSTTVQPPKGYGPPTSDVVAGGLINPEERAETEARLKALADR